MTQGKTKVSDFVHIVRCLDLGDQDVAMAVVTRAAAKALLDHLASISAPNTGVAKVLLVFARMATSACDWLDGDLHVELVGDQDLTVIESLTELGGGLRERVFAPTSFRTAFAEFTRAVERVPHLVAPLTVLAKSTRRLSLSVTAAVRRTSIPPPPIEIASESLFVRVPAQVPLSRDVCDALPLPVVTPEATEEELFQVKDEELVSEPPAAGSSASDVASDADVDDGWDD